MGGAPTYVLTDNEKTVTVEHVAGVPVRNQQTVVFARHYGVTVLTCEPADPATKGGVESSVKVAKADIVPKDTNLRAEYDSFAELEAACEAFMDEVNTRVHRVTRRVPAEMLAEERARLHPVPDDRAHGRVRADPGRSRRTRRWSPSRTASTPFRSTCSASRCGSESTAPAPTSRSSSSTSASQGPVEVARHRRARPGSPADRRRPLPGHRPKQPRRVHGERPRAGRGSGVPWPR